MPETWAIAIIVLLRASLLVLCAETGWRFARWFWDVRTAEDTKLLRDLMLGIAVVQAGFLLFTIYALVMGPPRHPSSPAMAVLILGDSVIASGTILHLVPAWRISNAAAPVIPKVALRAVAAAIVAGLILMLEVHV